MSEKLSTYRAKRDFKTTSEPSGETEVAPGDRLRFVIQKHDATRLHYDLRLELDGVFKSWAVTRGPSLDPADKRLAVEVEDHPLDYGDFEGIIPEGQYGGGTVMLWDRGYWAPEPGTTAEGGLKDGDLKAVFEGERMHGSWVLVRMKHDRERSKRTNWLLIKHKDKFAKAGDKDKLLTRNETSVASGRAMEVIAGGKGKGPTPFITAAKAGGGRKSAKRVWNSNRGDPEASAEAAASDDKVDLATTSSTKKQSKTATSAKPKSSKKATPSTTAIPDFVPLQLCRSVDRPPSGRNWVHEIKFDGYRMQLRVAGGKATLKSRRGLDWSDRFPELIEAAADLPDGLADGEVVALDPDGSPDFAGLQAALSSGGTGGLVFFVFDLLFDGGEDIRPEPLAARKARLQAYLDAAPDAFRFVEHFENGGEAVLKSACSMQLEGVVSKRLDAPYVAGRSDTWMKAKCRGGQEVVIAGWTTEGTAPLRSLIAGVQRDGKLAHVGRIGTGFSADKVAALMPKLKAVETDKSPFGAAKLPWGRGTVHWAKPTLVAEIGFAGWTGDGHLRQASFKGLREDKPADEVVKEEAEPVKTAEKAAKADVEAPPEPAKAAKGEPAKAKTSNVVMRTTISHPDKALWPAAGNEPAATKLDLARYFEAVAERLMPHIEGRPCSVIRAPDGITGQTFFQRHAMPGASSMLTLATVSGDRKPYLQIDRPEGLIAVAQTGGCELHPWNCAPGAPETPGRLVFDLDPAPDVPFEAVIAAAKSLKDRLEGLGLQPFLKTTGGKGLHVVTPLKPSKATDWAAAKGFAREVCAQMAADDPARYLIVMSKAKRAGRIFLDYLRNDRMSTAVAPYSPRARPGAPVSWPIAWSQARKGLEPMAYTLRTVLGLLKKADPWADYDAGARPLAPAIRRLGAAKAA